MFWMVLPLFVVTDLVVIAVVFRRMSPALRMRGFPGAANRSQHLRSAHTLVGAYLRVNYSGEPEPQVVRALVEIAAPRHRIAPLRQLREALATVP